MQCNVGCSGRCAVDGRPQADIVAVRCDIGGCRYGGRGGGRGGGSVDGSGWLVVGVRFDLCEASDGFADPRLLIGRRTDEECGWRCGGGG